MTNENLFKFVINTRNWLKLRILRILEDSYFEKFIFLTIILNIFFFIVATDKTFFLQHQKMLFVIELIVIITFTLELILRLLTLNSLKELFKPLMLIDILAVVPFYLTALSLNVSFIRVLRLCKFFQILKLARYSKALHNIGAIFINKKEELIITSIIFATALIVSSSIMYFIEGGVQQSFSSIPQSLWWGVITFTSVGYGDVVPQTDLGKFVAAFFTIIGVCIHSLLIGIFGAGFIEVMRSNKDL